MGGFLYSNVKSEFLQRELFRRFSGLSEYRRGFRTYKFFVYGLEPNRNPDRDVDAHRHCHANKHTNPNRIPDSDAYRDTPRNLHRDANPDCNRDRLAN